MAKPSGAKLGLHSISHVLHNLKLVGKLAVIWSVLAMTVVGTMCLVVALNEGSSLTEVMVRMQEGDLLRVYLLVSSIPTTLGQLAVAIRWSRLVLLGETPHFTLAMPRGSARYFVRSVVLLFAVVLLAVPGFIAGAILGQLVPGDLGRVAGVVAMVAGGLISAYVCIRMWLVFPAIAVGDDAIDFRHSFELSKGFTRAMFFGTLIAYVPFVLVLAFPAGLVTLATELNLAGEAYIALTLLSEFAMTFLLCGAVAASAGVLARIYRDAVPNAVPNPQMVAVFE